MAEVTINVSCEVTTSLATGLVRDALTAELAVIAEDLGLEAEFPVEVRMTPVEPRKAKTGTDFRLYVDGKPLDPPATHMDLVGSVLEAMHAQLPELITTRFVDQLWGQWGGRSVAPPAFVALLRQLVRQRIRPDRVSHAVATWQEQKSLRLFEDALGQVSRKLLVHVHPDRASELAATFAPADDSPAMMMIDGLFYELGILVGECEVVADEAMPPDAFRVRINDLRSAPMNMLGSEECLVNDTVDRLILLNIKGREAINPANGAECAIIPKHFSTIAEQAGLTTWDPGGWVVLNASTEVRKSAAALLTFDALQSQLHKLEAAFPYLIAYVRNGIGEERFARVLRHLLDEEISIRNIRQLIDGLATISPPPQEPIDLSRYIVFPGSFTLIPPDTLPDAGITDPAAAETAESLRSSLKRYISHKYTRGGNTLVVYLLDPVFEERFRSRRRLSRAEHRWFLEAVGSEAGNLPPTSQNPCVLTSMEIRRRVRCELEASFPHLAVLSYQELSPDMNIQPIARISADNRPEDGPLDLVDKAMAELRFDEAQEHIAEVAGSAWPATSVEPRIAELLYFWNEAGRADRVAQILTMWRKTAPMPGESETQILALRDHPDRAAVRQWLAARDPLRFRRLCAHYLPGIEDLARVTGGRFTMGDSGGARGDRPAHAVEVDDFDMAPLPVTGRQFALYLSANDKPIPKSWVEADDAARGISWREAIEYCVWLSRRNGLDSVYEVGQSGEGSNASAAEPSISANHARNGFRLPTEAEWEFAARGGTASRGLRFAGSDRLAEVGDVMGMDPVGWRLPNELGIYDMTGGRAEWCWDWYGPDFHRDSPAKNPMGPPEGTSRVCRGGDVTGVGEVGSCTVYAREGIPPRLEGYRSMNLGFRLARNHNPER